MRIVTRTVYGSGMQSAQFLGIPYTVTENSTLNEKFGIQVNAVPAADERHSVQYFCIGNGGHRAITGADGIPFNEPNQHEATDAACFNHLPFVLREVTNDLTVEQRAKYALRREETHNGRQYFAYYAKRLTLENTIVNLQRTQIDGESKTSEPFVPTAANLNPTPLAATAQEDEVIEASGEYVSASAVVTIALNEADADELRNVARVLYGDEKYAIISEIALVGGIDRTVSGPGPGNTSINYKEVIAAQVTSFIVTYQQMNMTNNGMTYTADVGNAEPLYAVSSGV